MSMWIGNCRKKGVILVARMAHNLPYYGYYKYGVIPWLVAWLEKSAVCHSREGGNLEKTLKIGKII